MKKYSLSLAIVVLFLVPTIAAAQSSPTSDPSTTIGGSSPFDYQPGGTGYTPPTAPPGGPSTGITTTPGGSSTGNTSAYCSGVGGTLQLESSKLGDVLKWVTCLIEQSIMPLLFALALAAFIWGMVKFISTEGAAEKEQGRQFMIWGVIAFFVMFSIWGLVRILGDTFGLSNTIPTVSENPK